jgi:tetratricopeptide (TPR) repeat protein
MAAPHRQTPKDEGPAPPPGHEAALARAAQLLDAIRARHAGGLVKRRYGARDREEFHAAFSPVVPYIEARFGRTMDKSKRMRTEPVEERLMGAAAKTLFDLDAAGEASGLFTDAAALGVLTFYVGDYKDALYWVNLAAKTDPEEPANKLNGAVLAAEFFDFDLALQLIGQVLGATPDEPVAWALKGRALVGLKLAEEAKAAEVEKRGDHARAKELRKRAKGRVDEAASALREVARLRPSDPRAWYEYAKFLFTHGRLKDAGDAYGRAVAADPPLKLAWYQKGVCHQMLEEVDPAIDAFSRGLSLDRRDAGGVHFRIAAMRALKGDKDGALADIAAGLAVNKPNFYSELYRIEFGPLWGDPRWEALVAEFFADTGFQHTKKAQAEAGFSWGLFEHGSILFYDSLADAFGAAEAYRREGDLEKAREFYTKLVDLLERERHPLKAAVVRARLSSLPP